MSRLKPNVLITGTPGVGKSTVCEKLTEMMDLEYVNIGKLAEENNCLSEYDEVYKCPVLNEDKIVKVLKKKIKKGGFIVDYHGCDFFPEDWFDGIFVLRSDTSVLYDRLTARNYTGKKLDDNMQSEIFQTILEEAKESYKEEIIFELQNNNNEDLLRNCQKIATFVQSWLKNKNSA